MTTVGEGVVEIGADFGPFDKDLRGAEKDIGSRFAKIGKAFAGAAAGAAGAFALGKEVLATGAQLEGFRKKATTVFEGSAADIRKWADANNETFGVTDDQLIGLAASFGDLLKPMGFTAAQAAEMSKDVIGLSGALSEWTGGQRSAAEVSDILAKAMLGEREGLKELGISISEADVWTRLALKGQKDLTGAALEQAKALATQELIFEKSTDAQKAYASGGNEALRATNNIKAGFGELREQIAERLLPIALQVAQWAGEQIPKAMDWAAAAAETLKARWDAVWPTVSAVFETFGAVVSTVIDTVRGLFSQSESDVDGSASRLAGILASLQATFASVFGAVKVIIETWVAVVTDLWGRFGDDILEYARKTFDNILTVVGGVLDAIRGVFELFAAVFTGDWSRAWDAIKTILGGVWDAIGGIVDQALNLLNLAVQAALGLISAAWSLGWNAIATALSDIWSGIKETLSLALGTVVQWFKDLPGRAVAAVKLGAQALVDIGRWIVKKVLEGIDQIKTLMGWFSSLPAKGAELVMEGADKLVQLGKDLIGKIIDGIKSAPGAIADAIGSLLPGSISIGGIKIGDGPGAVPSGAGSAGAMARSAVARFGGRVTSTYRTPAHNASIGGSPTSYHLDRNNPAHDIVGPNMRAMFDFLYRTYGSSIREMIYGNQMVRNGQLMPYRKNDHWDHVHVAHRGGHVTPQGIEPLRRDELLTKLQVGETVLPAGEGLGGRNYNLTVVTRDDVDVQAEFRRLELLSGAF